MQAHDSNRPGTSQHTLAASLTYVGIGLHSGRRVSLTLRPAAAHTGINFIRTDVAPGQGLIPARWYNVVDTDLCTVIGNEHGVILATVEHLMAALQGCGVDNVTVLVDGPEVPIMDGSAGPFVDLIRRTGLRALPACRSGIWIHRPIEVREADRRAVLLPSFEPRITVEIEFPEAVIGAQALTLHLNRDGFLDEVAAARTFGFEQDIDWLRERGKARGGSLRNAVVVGEEGVLNPEGLRFPDEFVRHKALDALGDLALAGVPVLGHYYGFKSGHALNTALVRKLFDERGAWSYIRVQEFNELTGQRQDTGSVACGTGSASPAYALKHR